MTEQARTAIEFLQSVPKRHGYPVNIKPKEAIPKRSPTLDLLVEDGKLMWRECAWCHAFLGYTAGNNEPNETTYEICKRCSDILKLGGKES
uniref:Uncharacterized protein n=1 Tax=viral metagenome TaxID=1070528 RepID=A0A6M3IN46_9ZZZZ